MKIIFYLLLFCKLNSILIENCRQIKEQSEIPFGEQQLVGITSRGFMAFGDDKEENLIREVAYDATPNTVIEINKKVLELKSNGLDDKKINEFFQGISEESKKSTDNGPTGTKFFGYVCGNEQALDIERCITLIKQFDDFVNEKGTLKCYQQLKEDESCDIEKIYIIMNLENNFVNKAITENQFDFGVQYALSVLRFLIISLESKVLPEYNNSPFINWISNGGYYFDSNDQMQFFTSKFSDEKPKDKELSSNSINTVSKQYFSFLKHLFIPNKTCIDIIEQYVEFSSEIHQVVRNDGSFPLKYNHTLEFLQQSSNFQGDNGIKVGLFLVLVSFCYEHTTFGVESLKSIENLLSSLIENGKFFNDQDEKKKFQDFFINHNFNQAKKYDKETIQTWIEQFYSNVSAKSEQIKNKKYRLYKKIKQIYDNSIDEESKEYLRFVQQQLGLGNIFDTSNMTINPNAQDQSEIDNQKNQKRQRERKLKLKIKKWKERKQEVLLKQKNLENFIQNYFSKKIKKNVIQLIY